VNLNAKGFFFEEDLPDYKNLMDGNRLDIYILRKERLIRQLLVEMHKAPISM
jgi:hypothetical protein